MMENHATRMTQLIEDLLSLSRIELNENTPPAGRVDLKQVLSSVVASLEIPAAQRSIDVAIEPGPGTSEAVGDENEISQLFQNLIDNAIKYSREGALVRILIREAVPPLPSPLGEKSDYIEVSVIDQGPGIPAEHIPRLTERFYRVDTARSREMGGTGLGLAIVKHIIGRHRGAMTIQSGEGKGSTFSVFLPAARAAAPAPEPADG
jgi:two-component system phosphate regulon sensor histidine kinase PhoR